MSGTRRKRKKRKELAIVIVMLLLCVLAVCYIIHLVSGSGGNDPSDNNEAETQEQAQIEQEQEEEAAREAEESAALARRDRAATHVYSHRGAAGGDELTIDVYDRVIEAGSKYIEADMVVSNSGTIYLAHDDYARDMTGINGYFSGMTDAQIDSVKTRTGCSIYKLTDLFEKYGDSVTYLIDIKYTSSRNIVAFVDTVKESGLEDNVIATSFYMDALKAVDSSFPEMTKLFLCSDQPTFNVAIGTSYVDIACVPSSIMTEDNLKAAHDHDKRFSVWTLNSEEEILRAIEIGADSYFTDDTALAIRLEEENRPEE